MSSQFRVEPEALAQAGKAFAGETDAVNAAAIAGQNTSFGTGNAGHDYAAEGAAFHKALLTYVQTVLSPMAAKTTWVGQTLASTAADYRKRDRDNDSRVTRAGKGA